MASAESQKTACPVCNQADQVKTMQAAYNTGVARCAPPDMPTRTIPMTKYIVTCAVIVGACVFCIIVFIGGLENSMPQTYQMILASLTLLSIIGALSTSYVAFQKVVKGDNEAQALFPAWDKATAEWKKLYYCSRDDVVFNPETHQTITNEQLANIRTSATHQIKGEMQHQRQSAAIQH
jgi:hypothetical protein